MVRGLRPGLALPGRLVACTRSAEQVSTAQARTVFKGAILYSLSQEVKRVLIEAMVVSRSRFNSETFAYVRLAVNFMTPVRIVSFEQIN